MKICKKGVFLVKKRVFLTNLFIFLIIHIVIFKNKCIFVLEETLPQEDESDTSFGT